MSDVRISRANVFLVAALVVALLGAALLLGMLLGKSSAPPGSPEFSVAALTPTSSVDAASAEATQDPTPNAQLADGSELPGLLAAIVDCNPLDSTAVTFGQLIPDGRHLSPRDPPDTLEVRSPDESAIQVGGINDPLALHGCVLGVLEAPPGVMERMNQTRAIDGTLSETWPGYVVTWTYHPDQGLVAVFSYDK